MPRTTQTVRDYVRLSHRMDVAGVRFRRRARSWGARRPGRPGAGVGLRKRNAGEHRNRLRGTVLHTGVRRNRKWHVVSGKRLDRLDAGRSHVRAGADTEKEPPFLTADQVAHTTQDGATANVVQVYRVSSWRGPQGKPVLDGTDLTIAHGERVLLEGPSGGGKSSLASLLVDCPPDAGLLLLNGLDRHTLGTQWQRVATEAPQFHENRVFGGTLDSIF